jgi:class 3 adenylate cyclase
VVLVAIELRHLSSALASQPAEDVVSYLTHCFKAFDSIVDRFGLEKLKTIGDTYIAIAGLPTPGAHDGVASVEAALAMREFLDDLTESRRAHGAFVLDARIAVHAGSVVAGIVETSKLSYDVFGGAMKTLFTVLRSCNDNEVAVSDAARRLAGDGFAWRELDASAAAASSTRRLYGVKTRGAERLAQKA